jgi:hypothetical protein
MGIHLWMSTEFSLLPPFARVMEFNNQLLVRVVVFGGIGQVVVGLDQGTYIHLLECFCSPRYCLLLQGPNTGGMILSGYDLPVVCSPGIAIAFVRESLEWRLACS